MEESWPTAICMNFEMIQCEDKLRILCAEEVYIFGSSKRGSEEWHLKYCSE